jgi:hypothetical protein
MPLASHAEEAVQIATEPASSHREQLLDRFFALGRHPRILLYLRGDTEAEEWESLERLVLEQPDENDLDNILRGRWRRWWDVPPPTR